jgi:hypothetical protein
MSRPAEQVPVQELAQAIYTVNRHAKTAPEPKHLYNMKKEAIHKLIKEKRASKVGLHFSDHPKFSNQHSTLLVKVDNFYFHIPPAKEDFQELEHLGSLDQSFRNPTVKMSLSQAKRIIYKFIGGKPEPNHNKKQKNYRSPYYIPSALGKFEWPSKKSHRHRHY